ncbi:Zinc/iron permease, partial [Dimargaris cristalligena]
PDCNAVESSGEYSVPMHIVAILTVLIISAAGAVLPVLGVRYPKLRIPPVALEIGKHFGTGVVLATGFIHLLPDALFNLTDPCLPISIRSYPQLAGVLVLVASLLFHLIEFLATMHTMKSHPRPVSPTNAAASLNEKTHTEKGGGRDSLVATSRGLSLEAASSHERVELHVSHGHVHGGSLLENGVDPARRISTYMLEFGIALHSIFVGLALGTAEGTEFVSLWAALAFHQFFEGIALGSRIAELPYKSVWVPLLNAVLVASTTPLGAVFGMGIRSVYRARSAHTLIIQGVLNAISSGMLIYTALVNLIAQEFSEPSFMGLPSRMKFLYIVSLYFGAVAMGLVGVWA